MSTMTHVVGVDPGLVHTGVVALAFDEESRMIWVSSTAIPGPDANAVRLWVNALGTLDARPRVFIEQYIPRQRLNTDRRMVEAEANFRASLPKATFVRNTGVKKIVTSDLMQMLNVWLFNTPTHHQDLRSAARIMLYGMMKDNGLNRLLSDVVRDAVNGDPWDVLA